MLAVKLWGSNFQGKPDDGRQHRQNQTPDLQHGPWSAGHKNAEEELKKQKVLHALSSKTTKQNTVNFLSLVMVVHARSPTNANETERGTGQSQRIFCFEDCNLLMNTAVLKDCPP